MSKFLITTSEIYRVESESAAERIINEAKKDGRFELAKYTAIKKNRKEKKEIVDEWIQLTLVKKFCDEKEPDCTVDIEYNYEAGAFPEPKTNDKEEDDDELPMF